MWQKAPGSVFQATYRTPDHRQTQAKKHAGDTEANVRYDMHEIETNFPLQSRGGKESVALPDSIAHKIGGRPNRLEFAPSPPRDIDEAQIMAPIAFAIRLALDIEPVARIG
jgi:hypothetical protein